MNEKNEQDLGYVQIEYDLIRKMHLYRNKHRMPNGKKMFLKDAVKIALTDFLERNEK